MESGALGFADAVATLPAWVRIWALWLSVVSGVTPVVLLIFRGSRRDGLIVLAAGVAISLLMPWLYGQVGFVRLLGLAHIVVWTPLAIYLFRRLRRHVMHRAARAAIGVFLVSILISLVFDYVDVARYIAGDRAPMGAAAPLSE